ncbi:hypothetical protein [Microcoleus sp. Pol17_C1]|uniref:hypothetical protein n=1 Tax=unclassified Microcoleus TaxID=2642155 RepID=UPI002FD55365
MLSRAIDDRSQIVWLTCQPKLLKVVVLDEMDVGDPLVWHSAYENQMTLGYNCCKSW